MTGLERQLTAALKRLSAQYAKEQRRQSGQAGALERRVETLRRQVERLSGENEALQAQVERLSGQVTDLTGYYEPRGAKPPGRWR